MCGSSHRELPTSLLCDLSSVLLGFVALVHKGSVLCVQDTAVLATLPLVATITSLSFSPVPTANAPATAMALPTVLPALARMRALRLPHALAAGVHSATGALRALAALQHLESLDISHAHVDVSAVDTLVAACPGCGACFFPASYQRNISGCASHAA